MMRAKSPILARGRRGLASFRRDERGMSAIEFAIIAPFMILLLLGTATYFVMGREDYRGMRATFTAADMVARQSAVNDSFLANVKSLAERVATPDARTLGIRVSSASKIADAFVIDWSYATAPYARLATFSAIGMAGPDVAEGESVIVVETSMPYRPLFGLIGSASSVRKSVSFARPRTVARVTKSD